MSKSEYNIAWVLDLPFVNKCRQLHWWGDKFTTSCTLWSIHETKHPCGVIVVSHLSKLSHIGKVWTTGMPTQTSTSYQTLYNLLDKFYCCECVFDRPLLWLPSHIYREICITRKVAKKLLRSHNKKPIDHCWSSIMVNGTACRQWGFETDHQLCTAPAAAKQLWSKPQNLHRCAVDLEEVNKQPQMWSQRVPYLSPSLNQWITIRLKNDWPRVWNLAIDTFYYDKNCITPGELPNSCFQCVLSRLGQEYSDIHKKTVLQ